MNNFISKQAMVSKKAEIGSNNQILAGSIIGPNVKMGDNNIIYPYAVIGTESEQRDPSKRLTDVCIGSFNIIREHVTINGGNTKIKNDNYIMSKSHIGHGSKIDDHVTISPSCVIGGEVSIEDFVNLGMGSIIHQFSVIPIGCMIGMGSIVTKKSILTPFDTYVGVPVKFLTRNTVGENRCGLSKEEIEKIRREYEDRRLLSFKI